MASIPSPVHWTRGGPVEGEASDGDLSRLAVQSAATVADALPLGMAALGTALVTSGAMLATWFRPTWSGLEAILPGVLIFGGLVQLLAAMWAFRRDDLLGATGFGVFGAFFGLAGVVGLTARTALASHQFGPLGVLVACFGLIALFLAVAGWRVGATMFGTYAALAIALFLAAATLIGNLNLATMVASGWAAVASGLIALYLAGAYTINSYYGRSVLPLRLSRRRLQIKLVMVPPDEGRRATAAPHPQAG
ncbi:MAG TPA: GPR1/FUN34/YaaH family transporter [Candidatus Dormibacteraeota bacterium]|jgi:succinate-acetate transporter protein|nr:GPR1/FUN34/YaaH family transporter [Candidatus Dormibacteraeota bacterium]